MAFRCESCEFRAPKWMGFCPQCRASQPLQETGEVAPRATAALLTDRAIARLPTGWEEFDRVLGGGLVPGAALLMGGEPGIGKSTLLLQIAASLAAGSGPTGPAEILLATAEESLGQVGLRASRLGASGVQAVAETDVDQIVGLARRTSPAVLIVDSIQTVAVADATGVAGGVTHVREAAGRLIQFAKQSGTTVVLVGHVTKDGSIAGPKQLEHLVDVVLSLEGDGDLGLRVLRSQKNRFGATHQVGLFEMTDAGLIEVTEPLLGSWAGEVPGTVALAGVEGRRSILVEIQALVAPTSMPQPRRSVKGLEAARLHQLLAVLDRHAGLSFAGSDVYVNVAGGMRVREPAADLAVALALVSSLLNQPLGPLAAWGEVGLTGEVRPVGQTDRRRQEASRRGLRCLTPLDKRIPIETLLAEAGLLIGWREPVVASGTDGQPNALLTPRRSAAAGSRNRAS